MICKIANGVDGRSQFEELTVVDADRLISGLAIEGMTLREFASDFEMASHPSPRRQLVITLAGSAEVTTADGRQRRFGPGDAVLYEDTSGAGHATRVVANGPRLTLVLNLAGE